MNQKNDGSVILVMVLIIAVVIIDLSNVLRSSVYLHEIAIKQEQQERQYRATESLLFYGIAWVKKHGLQLSENKTVTLNIGSWPPMYDWDMQGVCKITKQKKGYKLSAILSQKGRFDQILSCQLKTSKSEKESESPILLKIQDWTQE